MPIMKSKLIKHDKITDEYGNTTEIKLWTVPKTADKPYGFKYSLAYIVNNKRVIGYDNAERKGDHRHYKTGEEPYRFISLEKLTEDFRRDVENFKKENYENKKSESRHQRPPDSIK